MSDSAWQPTACILCECNCGIEVRLGGDDGRRFERIRGDKAHPASHGYTCEKALRLDHYQNGRHRLTSPMRRRADGTYEEIDWDTAIDEIAERFAAVRDTHGGESIFYYGGGGQGNHLGGSYATATRAALGSWFRSNALAQEKTGEFWVNAKMLGTHVRGDFEHTEVAVFVGKNPWQSHSIPHARTTLKEIARDPARVADRRRPPSHRDGRPRRPPPPGAARHGRLVHRRDLRRARPGGPRRLRLVGRARHRSRRGRRLLRQIDVGQFAAVAGVDEQLVRTLALALLVPCLALLWLVGVPGTLTPISYMLFAALLTALTVVAMITYSNAQATSSMAQLIHEADIARHRTSTRQGGRHRRHVHWCEPCAVIDRRSQWVGNRTRSSWNYSSLRRRSSRKPWGSFRDCTIIRAVQARRRSPLKTAESRS